jgi:hypothetical protein
LVIIVPGAIRRSGRALPKAANIDYPLTVRFRKSHPAEFAALREAVLASLR